jgi:hypothetical protein
MSSAINQHIRLATTIPLQIIYAMNFGQSKCVHNGVMKPVPDGDQCIVK